MFVLMIRRVIKVPTGSTQRYAPRSTSRLEWTVCGVYRTQDAANKVLETAAGTHTFYEGFVGDQAFIAKCSDINRLYMFQTDSAEKCLAEKINQGKITLTPNA